jgi:transcriptional regulator with XRE-family HTH domain
VQYKQTMPDVGGNIKKCREIRNYTQDHMARELDISTTAYRNIEGGKTAIKLDYIYAIAEILSVNINALLYYDEQVILNIYNSNNNTKSQSYNEFRDIVTMLKTAQEKIMEMADKNSQLSANVNIVALSVTRLVRELARTQKKK